MPPIYPGTKTVKKNGTTADPNVDPTGANNGQTDAVTTAEQNDALNARFPAFGTSNSHRSKDSNSGSSFSITPKETAYSQLDQTMIKLFGRRATAEEKSTYYKSLNIAEKHYASVSSSTSRSRENKAGDATISTGTSTSTNYNFDSNSFLFEFTANLASNYVKEGKPLGGIAGQTYDNLKSYATSMGLSDDDKTIIKNTLKVMKGTTDETALKTEYRKRAISLYGGLAESLKGDPTLTVREAASDYINIMSNMLDINTNNISLHDPTLSKALNANKDGKPYTMNLNEFSSYLRDDSRFQFSTTAHEEARTLASSFAQAFGFGG